MEIIEESIDFDVRKQKEVSTISATPEHFQVKNEKGSKGKAWLIGIITAIIVVVVSLFIKQGKEAIPQEPATIPISKKNSVAVLPFANFSAQENTFFADGVMEDILANLAKFKTLKVISRTSSMQYRSTDKTVPEIGQELGVDFIVEGSVRLSEDRIIVTVQLIKAAADEHLWAETYERDQTDLFAIQSEVAKKIATTLNQSISPELSSTLNRQPTNNIEAYIASESGESTESLINLASAYAGIGKKKESIEYIRKAWGNGGFSTGAMYNVKFKSLLNGAIDKRAKIASQPETYKLEDRIFVRHKEKMVKLEIEQVLYVEADRNYSRIHSKNKEYMVAVTLKNMASKLPGSVFYRIHRSYIVNLLHVDEVAETHLVIAQKALPISKTLKAGLLKRLQTI